MNDTPIMRVALFAATLPLLFLVVGGVGYIFGGGDFNASVGHILYRVALLGCPLVALVGLWLCATMPKLGLGMVVAGALTTTAAYFWMAPIGVPLALAIIVFAIKRSGLSIWPFRGPRPSASGTA